MKTNNYASTLNKALFGLVMCSVSVIANAADSAPTNNSFTIRVVEKAPAAGQTLKTTAKAKHAAKAPSKVVPMAQRQASHNRTLRLDDGGVIWTTSDPVVLAPLLEVTTGKNIKLLDDRSFESPVLFTLNTNYAAFIDKWELTIYRVADEDERRPLKRFSGTRFTNGHQVEWSGDITSGQALVSGEKLKYVLTVKNNAGHSDVTRARELTLHEPRRKVDAREPSKQLPQNNLARQTIPLYGSRVRIYGSDIIEGHRVEIDGEQASITNQRFVIERLLPEGKHLFDVNITKNNRTSYRKRVEADVNGRYLFMVGLADVTIGEGNVSGNLETLSDGDKYLDGDIFVDGRLAFYLKGKIKGKYLITAQMDTGTAEIDELFDDIHKKDPQSVFRRLDPDRYYPVYGDDSTVVDDTNSQGKMYVRVDWDKSLGVWGNFNTDMTGTELSSFNRSIYGAKLQHKSVAVTKSGDHKTDLTVFGSEAQSAYRHNQFLGTGGSLYYLKDKDIVDGSEKVWVEVRDEDSERVLETVVMEEGRDYQIDDFQGRIILNRPLLQIVKQSYPSIIKDNPLDGGQVYLMVDYEYVPDDFDSNKASYGARGKVWLGNRFAVGASYAHENRDNDDYDLKGIDLTLKKSQGTYLVAEYAETESTQTAGSFESQDGGLKFDDLIAVGALADKKGAAYSVEARVNLEDYSRRKGTVSAWYQHREAGFSSARVEQAIDSVNFGVEASIQATKRLTLSGKVTQLDKKGTLKTTTTSLGGDYTVGDRLTVGAEVKHIKEQDQSGNTSALNGEGTLVAFKLGYDVNDRTNHYVIGQHTLSNSGAYDSNDLITVGTKTTFRNRLAVTAELSSGDRGDAATAGLDYKWNDHQSFYTNYTLSTDSSFDKRNIFTVGQRRSVSNRLKVYNEHQFTHETAQSGLGHTFGVDYDYNKNITLNSSMQTARLKKDTGTITNRDAFSVGLLYKNGKSSGSSHLEYRLDENESSIDAENTEQWVSTNQLNYRLNPSLRFQGKFNHSKTNDKLSNTKDATFTEAGVGFAYRPVQHDRLNVLGRLNYLYDLPPESQGEDPDEKSLTASLESTYQVNQRWQVGGKLAHKQSQIRSDRDSGTWAENDASLASARVTYHMTHNWDAMAGYHWMNSDASQDSQQGAMLSLDRHLGKNMKIGIGYNFTNFNDDLSNTDGDAEGWFVNLVGKY